MINDFRGRWAFLSNFYPATVQWEGIVYPSAEHAYNAAKTTDIGWRHAIAAAHSPRLAKKLGRRAVLRPNWDNRLRYLAMSQIVRAKFCANLARVDALLSTGTAVLVEGNVWHDQVWGDCYCGRPKCLPPGDNNLGLTLMRLRNQLLEGGRP